MLAVVSLAVLLFEVSFVGAADDVFVALASVSLFGVLVLFVGVTLVVLLGEVSLALLLLVSVSLTSFA